MLRRTLIFSSLSLILLASFPSALFRTTALSGTTTQAATSTATESSRGLMGEYYDTKDFADLKVTRTDATVDFDWSGRAPDVAVGVDTFSVRWLGLVQPRYSETYTFYTVSDNGVRLWVDGQLLIDNWAEHAPTEDARTITLAAGQKYTIRMEYYQNHGGAVAKLLWSSPSQPKQIVPQSRLYPGGAGLVAEYYDTKDFSDLKVTRTDATVDFDWSGKAPDVALGADTFSVRWIGLVQPRYSETYTFYTVSDDGVRLWVNDRLLINNWTGHRSTENRGTITLAAGQKYTIRMEYYQNDGGAVAKLLWSSPSQAKQIVPQSRLYPGGSGLIAEYYDTKDFSDLKVTRTDATVDFDWSGKAPDVALGADTFSVRWIGLVQPRYSETYTFYTVSDNGVRLWVDGQLLIDNWAEHAPTEDARTITLAAGQKYTIRMEYYQNDGGAVAKLLWSSPSQAKETIPQNRLYSPK